MSEEMKDADQAKGSGAEPAPSPKAEQVARNDSAQGGSGQEKKRMRKPRRPPRRTEGPNVDIEERVVAINRVAKVVKGGRRFSFSALIVVGDKRGKVGFGLGKAKEVPEAIRKAKMAAEKNMIPICVEKGTIPHEVMGEWDAGKILFRPAAEGTGIKAAGLAAQF